MAVIQPTGVRRLDQGAESDVALCAAFDREEERMYEFQVGGKGLTRTTIEALGLTFTAKSMRAIRSNTTI